MSPARQIGNVQLNGGCISLLIKGLTPNIKSDPARPPPPDNFAESVEWPPPLLVSPAQDPCALLARAARSNDLDGALCICLHPHPARTACVPFASPRAQHVPFLAARLASRQHHECFLHQRAIASNLTLIYAILSGRRSTSIDRMPGGEAASTENRGSNAQKVGATEKESLEPPPLCQQTHARSLAMSTVSPLARASVAVVVVVERVVPRALSQRWIVRMCMYVQCPILVGCPMRYV